MRLGEIGAGSFEFYEGIRILIPGVFAAGLMEGVLKSLPGPQQFSLVRNPFLAIASALAAGLLLYFIDLPAKSAAYNNSLPSNKLREYYTQKGWLAKESLNDFFLVFNTLMPSNIRARSLYMGSMFRIGLESILLVSGFQLGFWTYALHRPGVTEIKPHWVASALVLDAVVLLLRIGASLVREIDPSRGGRAPEEVQSAVPDAGELKLREKMKAIVHALKRILHDLKRDVGRIGLGILLVAVLLETFNLLRNEADRTITTLCVSALTILWLILFVWGRHPFKPRVHDPISPLGGLLLYLAPTTLVCLTALKSQQVAMRGGTYLAWLMLTVVPAVLIASRGHERKLSGAYTTERTWLRRYLEAREA